MFKGSGYMFLFEKQWRNLNYPTIELSTFLNKEINYSFNSV